MGLGTSEFVVSWLEVRLALGIPELVADIWSLGQTWLNEGLYPLLQVWLTLSITTY